jgi:biotin carboxyl carrier protein
LKFRVEVEDQSLILELQPNGTLSDFSLKGTTEISGSASVVNVRPGVYSILLEGRSFAVYLSRRNDGYEVWTEDQRTLVRVADVRSRRNKDRFDAHSGPVEVRSQMPGKVIELLVSVGSEVTGGQGLLVIEAMKMQNEVKSPKPGIVSQLKAVAGSTVVAGEILVVIE